MTDTIHTPEGSEHAPTQSASQGEVSDAGRHRSSPSGYGNGPVLAAGLLVGGAVLFAGWGVAQIATSDDGIFAHKGSDHVAAAEKDPGQSDDTVTVELPDKNHNGIADVLEDEGEDGAKGGSDDPINGRGDEDEQNGSDGQDDATEPKNETYIIEWGDTLTSISADTGVPIDMLVETNHIQNPNLIYAGSALLIPPV